MLYLGFVGLENYAHFFNTSNDRAMAIVIYLVLIALLPTFIDQ